MANNNLAMTVPHAPLHSVGKGREQQRQQKLYLKAPSPNVILFGILSVSSIRAEM